MKHKKWIAYALLTAMASGTIGVSAKDAVYIKENVPNAVIDGETVDIENPPLNIDGKVYIPLRFFTELFNKNVYWNDGVMTVGDQSQEVLADMTKDDYIDAKLGDKKTVDTKDMVIIKERLKQEAYDKNADPTSALAVWKEDGSFEGVEYFDSDTMKWSAKKHVEYVRTMVKAVYSPDNKYFGDKDIKAKIAKSLDYWVTSGRVECNNWYQQEIGVPTVVVDILMIEPEEMTDAVRDVLNQEAARGSIFSEKSKVTDRMTERPVTSTGANLTDKALTSFKIAIATANEKELYDIMHLIENELRVFEAVRTDEYGEDSDGIKADYSFHQHVDQIQSGSYGEVMLDGITKIIKNLKGTKYMLADHALNELANYILDGQQWQFRGDYRELTTAGRHITRPNGIKGMRPSVTKAVDALDGLTQIERYDELQTLKKDRLGETDTFTGNRHFWLSDYMSHNRNGYHVGIKLSSSRTKSGEVVNNENLMGYYMSDGVTTLMQDGDEYYNIMPLWNWNRLPGTTTPQGAVKNLNDWAEWNGEHLWNWKGNRNFVGGVSDGNYGAAVMDYSRDGLDAQKSWFMFDDQMVSLGNGINSYTDMDIYTNINQCVRDGDVVVNTGGRANTVKDGAQTIKNSQYILHDGIGYMSKGDIEMKLENRTGKYELINLTADMKDKTETNDIFEIGINHGKKPSNASYEYTTVFGADQVKMDELSKKPTLKVIRNDDKVQAVYDTVNKVTQAIVWKMDTIEIPGGLTVTANKKCALIIKELSDGTLEITASNPTNEPKDLQLVVNKILPTNEEKTVVKEKEDSTRIKFRLNEGIYAGSSTTYNSKTGFTAFVK